MPAIYIPHPVHGRVYPRQHEDLVTLYFYIYLDSQGFQWHGQGFCIYLILCRNKLTTRDKFHFILNLGPL